MTNINKLTDSGKGHSPYNVAGYRWWEPKRTVHLWWNYIKWLLFVFCCQRQRHSLVRGFSITSVLFIVSGANQSCPAGFTGSNCSTGTYFIHFLISRGFWRSQRGGSFDDWRLFFFSNCDVWRLNFRPFDGWLLLSRNLIQEFKWALISVLININCCVLEVDLAFHFQNLEIFSDVSKL